MDKETKKFITEKVKNAKTKAELAAVKATSASAILQDEAVKILAIRDEKNENMAFLNAITANRHAEISEENRQQWCNDRERMWLEVNRSVTATTLAEILHAALMRGIITEYHVTAADGDLMEGEL